MKRPMSLLLLLLLLVTLGPGTSRRSPQAQPDSPTAVLTSCKGPVTVRRASGSAAEAAFGLALNDGDEVKTGANAEAEIMFAAGNWVQVGPNSSMRIKGGHREAAAPAPSQNFEVVQNFLKLKSAEGTSSIGGLRSGDKSSALVAVSPVQTRVRDARPTFRWESDVADAELRLTLYNDSGVQWQSEVTGKTSAAYPTSAPALEPGMSYSWTLETTDPLVSPPLRTTAAFFEVSAPDDIASLDGELAAIDDRKPGPVTYHLMRASLFFDHGLVADAIAETESAVSSDPDNGALRAILGRLYAETGRTREAIDAMQRSQH